MCVKFSVPEHYPVFFFSICFKRRPDSEVQNCKGTDRSGGKSDAKQPEPNRAGHAGQCNQAGVALTILLFKPWASFTQATESGVFLAFVASGDCGLNTDCFSAHWGKSQMHQRSVGCVQVASNEHLLGVNSC